MSKAHKQYVLVWFVAGATYPASSVSLLEDAHKLSGWVEAKLCSDWHMEQRTKPLAHNKPPMEKDAMPPNPDSLSRNHHPACCLDVTMWTNQGAWVCTLCQRCTHCEQGAWFLDWSCDGTLRCEGVAQTLCSNCECPFTQWKWCVSRPAEATLPGICRAD